jgi:hypothetical protein
MDDCNMWIGKDVAALKGQHLAGSNDENTENLLCNKTN